MADLNATSWNRRKFLSLRGLSASTGGLLGAMLPEIPIHPVDRPAFESNLHVARMAMACEFSVLISPLCGDPLEAASAGLDEIDRQETRLTVYRDTSLVSRINREASRQAVPIDAELLNLLLRCKTLTKATEGAFDVTAGALIKAWGFFRGPRRVPSDAEIHTSLARTGMEHVEIDADSKSVRFNRPGIELNFGSIGKGYALDRAAAVMAQGYGAGPFLIQGGQSSMLGVGAPPTEPRGWPISIRSPENPRATAATVYLKDRALGTSGADHQNFVANGKRYGHVLDPRTGFPASKMAGASVLASSAADADALATAFFIAGFGAAAAYCEKNLDVSAILVPHTGDPDQPRPVALNLSEDRIVWNSAPAKRSGETWATRS